MKEGVLFFWRFNTGEKGSLNPEQGKKGLLWV